MISGIVQFSIVLAFLKTVCAVKCYICATELFGNACEDPAHYGISAYDCTILNSFYFDLKLDNQSLIPDDVEIEYDCLTVKSSYKQGGIMVRSTKRGCFPAKTADYDICDHYRPTSNPTIEYEVDICNTCTTDYCNSSSKLFSSLGLAVVLISSLI